MTVDTEVKASGSFKCTGCGADLRYEAGTTFLTCSYCGAKNEIVVATVAIEELDFETYLTQAATQEEQISVYSIKCESCGAISSVDPKIESTFCPYCSTPLIAKNARDEKMIRPRSLLPFKLNPENGKAEFKKWIDKLWFAPNALMKAALNFDHFKGVYLPYWTYDSATLSSYIGERGEYYYVQESYTTEENGKTVTKTRQVRHTRWYPAAGQVDHFFDDVITCASTSVPTQYVNQLEPWDLPNLVPFDEKYLSGFTTEKYQIDLKQGFEIAKDVMHKEIISLAKQDIGGDEQRIISLDTKYSKITFKHILLPAYISAYVFKGKLYRFLVNARTGEVQGERPWSAAKIAFAVITGIVIIGVIYYLTQK